MINKKILIRKFKYQKHEINMFDISILFKKYRLILKKIFILSEKSLENIKTFKILRGGYFIEIKRNNKPQAFFTLSNTENNFLELGDLIKLNKKFNRQIFSRTIKFTCKKIINLSKNNGICSYPNEYSDTTLLLSGFKIYKYYQRIVYLSILNLKIRLPFKIYKRKIHFNIKEILNFKIFFNTQKMLETNIKKLGLKIYKNSNNQDYINNFFKIGFIYEFELNNKVGDKFIIMSKQKYPISKINFQYSDNSV